MLDIDVYEVSYCVVVYTVACIVSMYLCICMETFTKYVFINIADISFTVSVQ